MSVAILVPPAFAHDPIFLSTDDRSPNEGPLLPDGTISFAVYGRLDHASATQGFQARLEEGELLTLSLLIPAKIPETKVETGLLPKVLIVRPDGSEFDLSPEWARQGWAGLGKAGRGRAEQGRACQSRVF